MFGKKSWPKRYGCQHFHSKEIWSAFLPLMTGERFPPAIL